MGLTFRKMLGNKTTFKTVWNIMCTINSFPYQSGERWSPGFE